MSHETSRFCSLVHACCFALRVVHVKFTSTTRTFRTSEYKQPRLLSFFKIKREDSKNFSGIAQCSVFLGRFSSHAKQRIEQVAQISCTKKHLQKAVFRDLFSLLLTMKTPIFEQAQSQLGYLRKNNKIFTNNETRARRGKRVKCCRQTTARSCL